MAIKAKPEAAANTWTTLAPYELVVDDEHSSLDEQAGRFFVNAVKAARAYATCTGEAAIIVHDISGKRGLAEHERRLVRRELRRLGFDVDGRLGPGQP
jgi:selenocysteine lyase/cysteine desulfurase